METISVQIGQRLKDIRKKRGLTQEQLGELVGRSYKYIGLIERGQRMPSIKTLAKIADELNVDIKDFFDFPKSGKVTEKERYLYRIWGMLKDKPKKDLELAERMLKSLLEK